MKNIKQILLVSIISSLITLTVLIFVFSLNLSNSSNSYIPVNNWPTFDKEAPYTINGPLWVGYDQNKNQWRYLKINFNSSAGESQRGLIDPGNPAEWTDKEGTSGYFSGNLNELPGGTHLNNRYNPTSLSCKYNVDDIMIKVGNFWVDKYESTVLLVNEQGLGTRIDDPKFGGFDSLGKTGNGLNVPLNAIAVSQRRQGSSGFSYFVAEQTAINNGKHIIRNEQWQAAAAGTQRSNATGMQAGGELWEHINTADIARYGVVGCAGSLWEWTSSWGQYGEHYSGSPANWYDWPGAGSYTEWDANFDSYGDDIVINVAGRAYTRQDSARYVQGLPSALVRGGSWGDHNRAGIFAVIADGAPSYYGFEVGFRCVK